MVRDDHLKCIWSVAGLSQRKEVFDIYALDYPLKILFSKAQKFLDWW